MPAAVRCARAAAFLLAALAVAPGAAAASDAPLRGTYVTDREVNASVIDASGRTYLAGAFSTVGPSTGAALSVTAASDVPAEGFPDVVGVIQAVEPDGAGGWFVGGDIQAVGGVKLSNLAHVRADRTVDAGWTPNPNSTVRALVRSGSDLFVGGNFGTIGGRSRSRLAKLSTSGTGAADVQWNPGAGGQVYALALGDGALFAGGQFSTVGPYDRPGVAKIATAGAGAVVDAWAPAGPGGRVLALEVAGTDLYVGGDFFSLGGQSRENAAMLTTTGAGAADAQWDPAPDGSVWAIEAAGSSVFLGGQFSNAGGAVRASVAKVAAAGTGVANATWDPGLHGIVYDLLLTDAGLITAGNFVDVGAEQRPYVARLATTGEGAADDWQPNPNADVYAVAAAGAEIVAGGAFSSAGPRNEFQAGLARLNPDGTLDTTWRPRVSGEVNALVLSGSSLFAGGQFTTLAPTFRDNLAKVSTNGTGVVDTTWAPQTSPGADIQALALSGDSLFVGGFFVGNWGSQLRVNLAKVSATGTGALDPWAPYADDRVNALTVAGGNLFVGGRFTSIEIDGGTAVPRDGLARIPLTGTGQPDPDWNPGAGIVEALVASGTNLYVGGRFTGFVGGQTRNRLAKVSTEGVGELDTAWDPNVGGDVRALALDGAGDLYVGGSFTTLGLQPYQRLARVAADGNGDADPSWKPQVIGTVTTLAVSPSRVLAGGQFGAVGTQTSQPALFDLTTPTATVTVPAEGARYRVGDVVAADYACADDVGTDELACAGPVAPGAPLDTSTAGERTFAVTATDEGGNTTTRTVSYGVDPLPVADAPAPPSGPLPPPGPVADVVSPVLSALAVAPSAFRAARTGAPTATARGRKPQGGRVTFRLTEAARISFTVIRPKSRKRRAKTLGRFSRAGALGANRFDLRGRIAGKRLAPGRYTLTARAVDAAGNRSAAVRRTFRIKR